MQTRHLRCDPQVLELLNEIVAIDGVDQAAVTDGGGDFLVSLRSDGCSEDGLQTLSAVLAEAVLSSASALAGRCGVGGAEDIQLQCVSGGLLLRPINQEQLLLVRYKVGTRAGLLRLVVRNMAARMAAMISKAGDVSNPAIEAKGAVSVMPVTSGITSLRDALGDSWSAI